MQARWEQSAPRTLTPDGARCIRMLRPVRASRTPSRNITLRGIRPLLGEARIRTAFLSIRRTFQIRLMGSLATVRPCLAIGAAGRLPTKTPVFSRRRAAGPLAPATLRALRETELDGWGRASNGKNSRDADTKHAGGIPLRLTRQKH